MKALVSVLRNPKKLLTQARKREITNWLWNEHFILREATAQLAVNFFYIIGGMIIAERFQNSIRQRAFTKNCFNMWLLTMFQQVHKFSQPVQDYFQKLAGTHRFFKAKNFQVFRVFYYCFLSADQTLIKNGNKFIGAHHDLIPEVHKFFVHNCLQ